MASPYDSAIEMFNLPRFGTGGSPFPQREDPVTSARRRFLEGNAQQVPEDYVSQRAMESEDPFGVLQEVENLRREREEQGFISDIAALNPSGDTYGNDLLGLIQKNPRIAQSKGALGLIDVQRQLAPKAKDYTTQFRDPVYRSSYQQKVKGGLDPDMAYEQTLSEAANEDMAIDLIKAGIPAERHGELMTGGAFDRRKVAQAIYGAKPEKPWTDRLSDKESEMVRSRVREALSPTDFELEYNQVKADAEKAGKVMPSKEEYVRTYKNAPSLKEYQIRRALESGLVDELQREFGLTGKDVASILGIQIPAQPTTSPLAPQTAPAPLSTPGVPLTPPTAQNAPQAPPVPQMPALPRDDESEKLWSEYLDLENTRRVDADSTNPSDSEADREIRGEMNQVRSKLMSKLKIPDTKEGRKLFENVWLGRKNSLDKTADSRGAFLSEPLKKTGVTGNSWVIRPA